MQVHYHHNPSVTPSADKTTTKLYYAKSTQAQHAWTVWTGTPTFVDSGEHDRLQGERDLHRQRRLEGHRRRAAHAPARHRSSARRRRRRRRAHCLMTIPRWDFNWQGGYYLQQPVTLQGRRQDQDAVHLQQQHGQPGQLRRVDRRRDVLRLPDGDRGAAADVHGARSTPSPACPTCVRSEAARSLTLADDLVALARRRSGRARGRIARSTSTTITSRTACRARACLHALDGFAGEFGARVTVRPSTASAPRASPPRTSTASSPTGSSSATPTGQLAVRGEGSRRQRRRRSRHRAARARPALRRGTMGHAQAAARL